MAILKRTVQWEVVKKNLNLITYKIQAHRRFETLEVVELLQNQEKWTIFQRKSCLAMRHSGTQNYRLNYDIASTTNQIDADFGLTEILGRTFFENDRNSECYRDMIT